MRKRRGTWSCRLEVVLQPLQHSRSSAVVNSKRKVMSIACVDNSSQALPHGFRSDAEEHILGQPLDS